MIPRIEAGERLSAIRTAMVTHNAGFENPLDRVRAVEELQARASGEDQLPPPPASAEDLAAMGIGLVIGEPGHD